VLMLRISGTVRVFCFPYSLSWRAPWQLILASIKSGGNNTATFYRERKKRQ
jgi:hypothetical protein